MCLGGRSCETRLVALGSSSASVALKKSGSCLRYLIDVHSIRRGSARGRHVARRIEIRIGIRIDCVFPESLRQPGPRAALWTIQFQQHGISVCADKVGMAVPR
jgi:hypothetical protein